MIGVIKLEGIHMKKSEFQFPGKIIKKNKNTDIWKEHKLRVGYFNVIYTLINLPADVYQSDEMYYRAYIVEKLVPINDYLASLNLQEIVTLEVEDKSKKEEGIYAYLVTYSPLFKDFTLWWMFKWLLFITASSFSIIYFDLWEKCIYLINLIKG